MYSVSHFGFEQYLRKIFIGYDKIYDQISLTILNDGLKFNNDIAKTINAPFAIVNHVLEDLNNRGLVETTKFAGGVQLIVEISPELRRKYRSK